MALQKVERPGKTLRNLTLEKLRTAVVQGYFRPGDRLVERTLCSELGVSRTVVREVLRHLETEGLVESVPNQGPIVARLDLEQVSEIYELRGLLEAYAARTCAANATPDMIKRLRKIRELTEEAFAKRDFKRVLQHSEKFYEALFESAKKKITLAVLKSLNARINRLRAVTIAVPGRREDSNREMNRLLDAIKRGDVEAASAASLAHIQRVSELAKAEVLKQSATAPPTE